jgi:hypothetical protein
MIHGCRVEVEAGGGVRQRGVTSETMERLIGGAVESSRCGVVLCAPVQAVLLPTICRGILPFVSFLETLLFGDTGRPITYRVCRVCPGAGCALAYPMAPLAMQLLSCLINCLVNQTELANACSMRPCMEHSFTVRINFRCKHAG